MSALEPPSTPDSASPTRRARRWRPLQLGCLALFIFACGAPALLVAAAAAGPVSLPGGAELRAGSQDVVLTNFSFQNGTSYFLDLHSSGARTIIEANYLEDSRTVQIVLHHSTRQDRTEQTLLSWPLP